jgi:hypothetical protein
MAASTELNIILRGAPKMARTSGMNAIAFIPGMTQRLSFLLQEKTRRFIK